LALAAVHRNATGTLRTGVALIHLNGAAE
jgi:hypothetical protein